MRTVSTLVLGVAIALAGLTAVGCGKGKDSGGGDGGGGGAARSDPAARNDLKQIGLAYHNYNDMYKGKAPPDADALKPMLEGGSAYQGLKDGRYVFIWNARLLDNTGGDVILAYQKDVPTQGGPVLFVDGSTKEMTANDFKSAKMAKAK